MKMIVILNGGFIFSVCFYFLKILLLAKLKVNNCQLCVMSVLLGD